MENTRIEESKMERRTRGWLQLVAHAHALVHRANGQQYAGEAVAVCMVD
jgi:hypothetical protein